MRTRTLFLPVLATVFLLFLSSSFISPSPPVREAAEENTETSVTIRVASYNLLDYTTSTGPARNIYFRRSMETLAPDILITQEVTSQAATDLFRTDVLDATMPDRFLSAAFHDGFDTDNALFYDSAKVTLVGAAYIATDLRDIAEYTVAIRGTADTLRLYSLHLKAGQTAADATQRLTECTTLRNWLNTLPAGTKFIIVGDYNVYTSTEAGFQKLLASETNNNGRAKDPLNAVGTWNNNAAFKSIHTQSTRTRAFGGGATGGLDDRFDILLTSFSSLDSAIVLPTYRPYGNDGNHFNDSINHLPNAAVPDSVANALHYASDHLPVSCDFVFTVLSPPVVNSVQFAVMSRWNMVSVPASVPDARKSVLFPTAVSSAFGYDGSGYRLSDTLMPGMGYWMKFAAPESITITGEPLFAETLAVSAGWNLVGTVGNDIPANSVEVTPVGNIRSSFFAYRGTYTTADILLPGHGYWVKVDMDGTLIFSASPALGMGSTPYDSPYDVPPRSPEQGSPGIPSEIRLYQNYPNPWNPQTRIGFDIPRSGPATLVVFNLEGKEVWRSEKTYPPGSHTVTVDGSALPSGIYFYRLQCESFSETRKMILLK